VCFFASWTVATPGWHMVQSMFRLLTKSVLKVVSYCLQSFDVLMTVPAVNVGWCEMVGWCQRQQGVVRIGRGVGRGGQTHAHACQLTFHTLAGTDGGWSLFFLVSYTPFLSASFSVFSLHGFVFLLSWLCTS
jgi:hypothetical protein